MSVTGSQSTTERTTTRRLVWVKRATTRLLAGSPATIKRLFACRGWSGKRVISLLMLYQIPSFRASNGPYKKWNLYPEGLFCMYMFLDTVKPLNSELFGCQMKSEPAVEKSSFLEKFPVKSWLKRGLSDNSILVSFLKEVLLILGVSLTMFKSWVSNHPKHFKVFACTITSSKTV